MFAWRKGFYGYAIVVSAFLVYFVLGGAYYSLSVLAPVMAADLGWSAAACGAAFSVFALTTGIGARGGQCWPSPFGIPHLRGYLLFVFQY